MIEDMFFISDLEYLGYMLFFSLIFLIYIWWKH